MREVLEVVSLENLHELKFPAPVRLVFPSPKRGGPSLSSIRVEVAQLGRVRFSGTANKTFADIDPALLCEQPIVALDTIVRSDAAGLERMLLSVLPYVDEIVIGVDGRSDKETLRVAQGYADCVYVFEAADIKMSEEMWNANRIDFAAARNLGRSRVHSPWTLVVDSDEFLQVNPEIDVRGLVADASPLNGCFFPMVRMLGDKGQVTFESRDHQRLARTRYRWVQPSHNQLVCTDSLPPIPIDITIVSDTSIRTQAEQARRDSQRDVGIEELTEAAAQGSLNALFHLAKHRAGKGELEAAAKLAEDFRLRVEPNGPLSWQRQWAALAVAFNYYNADVFDEANRWAVRALLDGPSIPAFCLLGDIAEDEGDLERALSWFECACAVTDKLNISWPGLTETRWGRLAALRHATSSPEATVQALAMKEAAAREDEAAG